MKSRWTSWWLLPVVMLSLGGWLQAGEGKRKAKTEAAAQAEATDNAYWIGLMAAPADPLLKMHLRLEAGVVVQHVVPDSPAAKAGVKENDIVLKCGDAKTEDPLALSKAVNEAQGHEATLTLLREGKGLQLKVTPQPRPAESDLPVLPGAPQQRLSEWMKQLEKNQGADNPFRMFFFGPGLNVPEEFKGLVPGQPKLKWPKLALQLPKNMSVTITKTDEGPAKIVVKQGEQTWEVNEEQLDKLPEDVRQVVQRLLSGNLAFSFLDAEGGLPKAPRIQVEINQPEDVQSEKPKSTSKDKEVQGLRKKLEEVQRQVDKLREQMQQPK